MNKSEAIIIHHSASYNGLKIDNEWHKTRWPDFISSLGYWLGYHRYIDISGIETKCREDYEEGAHCLGGWNRKSIGVCLQGNFDMGYPKDKQIDTLLKTIHELQEKYNIPSSKIYCHSELWPTACPGQHLREWLINYRGRDTYFLKVQLARAKSLLLALLDSLKGRQ